MQQIPPQSEKQNTEIAKVFSIIALVIASFSLIFSFIPCVGYYAVGPAVFALLFAIVPVVILKKAGKKIGVSIATFIVAIVAIGIGVFQYVTFKEVFEAKDELKEAFDENLERTVLDSLEQHIIKMNDSIKRHDLEAGDSEEW